MKKPITLLLLLSAGGLLASCGGRIDNTAPDYSGPYKPTSSVSSSSEQKASEISSSKKVEGSSEVISSDTSSSEIISSDAGSSVESSIESVSSDSSSGNSDESSSSAVKLDYDVLLGVAEEIELVDFSSADKGQDTWTVQYMATFDAASGDTFILRNKGTNITEKIGPSEGATNNLAVTETAGVFKIVDGGEGLTAYIKFYEDGGVSIYVTGRAAPATISTDFEITTDVGEGKGVFIAGSWNEWTLSTEQRLTWSEGNIWKITLELPEGQYQYKFLIASYDTIENPDWDSLNQGNRNVTVPQGQVGDVTESTGKGPEGSAAASWYIVGEGSLWGEDGWTTEGGVQLFTNPGSETDKGCILSLTFAEGDKFKVTDGTDWFGYDKVSQSTDGEVPNAGVTAFSDDGTENHNILCVASGTFDIYVNGEGQFWIQSSEGSAAPVVPEVIESTGKGPEGSTAVSWYIVGEGSLWGANGWTTAGGVQLFSNPGSETDKGCILGLTFAEGDKFKVTDGTDWFGYDKVSQSTEGEVANAGVTAFADDGTENHNIVCNTAGAYDIYVNGEGQFWIQAAAAE